MKVTAVLLVFCAALVVVQGIDTVVDTHNGPVRGFLRTSCRAFYGIPYATPPVGDLRWQYTEPAKPWGPKILDTTKYGPGCPQRCVLPPHTCPIEISEDCLYLNVYTPLEESDTLLPTMVFFPGGRFEQGSAGVTLYDGSYMVNTTNVILITASYRLGSLGFMKTPDLTGNYGIHDQREVLRWVQKNIKNFGGDPDNVLLFGQSAGAMSTATHLVSPGSKGLFHKVIIESDPTTLPFYDASEAEGLADRFAKDIGCSSTDLTCLRGKSVEDILAAEYKSQKFLSYFTPLLSFVPWTPVITNNGIDAPGQPIDLIEKGQFNHVPVALGTVYNEALVFIFMAWNRTLTDFEYDVVLGDVFLYEYFSVKGKYPLNSTATDQRPTLAKLGTDYIFQCTNRDGARKLSQWVPTYKYVFNHIPSYDAWGWRYPECVNYVCHGTELPFVFHSAEEDGYYKWTAAEAKLSDDMVNYWTNFAKHSDPNTGRAVPMTWPKYDPSEDAIIEFATPPQKLVNYRSEYCDYWDDKGYEWGFTFF